MQFLIILALLIAVVAVIFALQNTALVTISFLFWQFDGSLALVVLLAVLTGVLISVLASLPSIIKNQIGSNSKNKKIKEHEGLISKLEERLAAAKEELELYQVPPEVPVEPALPVEPLQPITPPTAVQTPTESEKLPPSEA